MARPLVLDSAPAVAAASAAGTGVVDTARCPLCGQPNRCALALPATGDGGGAGHGRGCAGFDACWCRDAAIAPAVLARIPEAVRGCACICPDCARQA